MSNNQSNSWPPFRSDEPLVAEVSESRTAGSGQFPFPPNQPPYGSPPKRSLKPLLGCLSVAVVLFFVFIGLVVALMQANPGFLSAETTFDEPELDRPLIEERASITSSLDGRWQLRAEDPKCAEVQAFINLLEKLGESEAEGVPTKRKGLRSRQFEDYVDWPAHMVRFYGSYRSQPVNALIRFQLRALEKNQFRMPPYAHNFKVAAIEERTMNDLYVYTYSQDSRESFLFHLRRGEKELKLVDWAAVAESRWNSEYNGAGTSITGVDLDWSRQDRIIDQLNSVDQMIVRGDYEGAARQLRQTEATNGIPRHHHSNLYNIATRWQSLNRPDEIVRVLNRIQDPNAYPLVHYLLARVSFDEGDHPAALKAIERFEKCAGYFHELEIMKIRCYVALKQDQLAEERSRRAVHHAPQDLEALSLAFEHVPLERLDQIFAVLPNDPSATDRLEQFAMMLLSRESTEKYQRVREFLAERKIPQERLLRLDAKKLHYEGELEQASAIFEKLMEVDKDSDNRELHEREYLGIQLQFKSPLEVYKQAKNPSETLELLTTDIEYDEALINLDDLEKILPLHQQRAPDDARLPRYRADVAMKRQDWSTAAAELTKAIEKISEEASDAYLLEDLRYKLLEARYHLGEGLKAYEEAVDRAEAFRTLASKMAQDEDWENLRALLELHKDSGEDLWAEYYNLQIRESEARRSGDTAKLFSVRAGYQSLARENAASNTIYPLTLDLHIDDLGVEGSDWDSFINLHTNPERVFPHLVIRFQDEGNQEALDRLLEIARDKFPDSSELHRFEVDQLWKKGDYAELVKYCETLASKPRAMTAYDYRLQPKLLYSHLILGNTAEAWKLASQPTPKVGYQWLVPLAEGDETAVRQFLSEQENPAVFLDIPHDAYRVPAIRKFVQSDQFARVREEHALPIQEFRTISLAVLIFDRTVEWTEEFLRERFRSVGLGDVEVHKLLQPPLTTETFVIGTDEQACLLTAKNSPYVARNELDSMGGFERDVEKAFAEHQSWIALGPRHPSFEISARGQREKWNELLAALAQDASLVWENADDLNSFYVVLTPEIKEQLASDSQKLSALRRRNKEFSWLSSTSDRTPPQHIWYARAKQVAEGGKPGRILVSLHFYQAIEELWLPVARVEHEGWGNYLIDVRLDKPSLLFPHLKEGALIRVSPSEIVQWED